MRIAYLGTFFPYGGFDSKYNSELYFELIKNNHINAYTFYKRYPKMFMSDIKVLDKAFIDEHSVPAKRILDSLNPASYIRSADKIIKDDPEIFITKFNSVFFTPALGSIAKKMKEYNIPTLCILNEWYSENISLLKYPLFRFFISQFDGFIVSSELIKEKIQTIIRSPVIDIHPHPIFNNFGDYFNKETARSRIGFNETDKIILYPVLFNQEPDISFIVKLADDLPDDFKIIVLTENQITFNDFSNKVSISPNRNKIRLEYNRIFSSDISEFFEASDIAILKYNQNNDSSMVPLCHNFDLPVITDKNSYYGNIVETYGTGIIVENKTYDNYLSEIQRYFNSRLVSGFVNNIKVAKEDINWKSLANKVNNICEMIS